MKIEKERFIKLFPMFCKNRPDLVDQILRSALFKKLYRGGYIYREGEHCKGIGFLLSGEIRVFKSGKSGREITLYEILPGDTSILDASMILTKRKYPASAFCVETGAMLFLSKAFFLRLIADYDDMQHFIFSNLSRRLVDVIEVVEEVTFGRMDERLLDYLIEKSEEGCVDATHQQIANDLGTSREVVSRLLKANERQGKLTLSRKKILLKDTECSPF